MADTPRSQDSDSQDDLFHFEEGRRSFDDLMRENGFQYWSARQLMELLEYASWDTFAQVINKAIAACTTSNVPVDENFLRCLGSDGQPDFKLSRFACYMVTLHADSNKPRVARAKTYFAKLAEAFQKYVKGLEDVERVGIRQKMTEHERSLSAMATSHGIEHYPFFHNKGYLGLYNMSYRQLIAHKGLPADTRRSLLDFMGKRELAANLFRVTETEARIENEGLHGQRQLETAAFEVGRRVRETMAKAGGPAPEQLPLAEDIKKVQGDIKRTSRGLNTAKKPSARRLPPPNSSQE